MVPVEIEIREKLVEQSLYPLTVPTAILRLARNGWTPRCAAQSAGSKILMG
jgi:hypothetical protein